MKFPNPFKGLFSKKNNNHSFNEMYDLVKRELSHSAFGAGDHYDAGRKGRLESGWGTSNDTPTANWKRNYKTIISRSISSLDNNPQTVSILNPLLSNVIGKGIRPTPRVKDKNGKLETTINSELADGWKRYNDQWDATGKMTYYEAQRVRFTEIFKTGTTLTNRVKAAKGSYLSVQNQIVNVLRLDDSHDQDTPSFSEPDNIANTVFGINLNSNGMPLSYWLRGLDTPVSAENMFHSFRTSSAEQYIGYPWLLQALSYLWANKSLITDQITSSRIQAMIGLFVPNDQYQQWINGQKNSDNQFEMAAGKVYTGKSGQKPEIIESSNTVTQVLEPLQKLLLHAISMTQGISYQTVTRDLVKTNMASGRINTNEDKKSYNPMGSWFAKEICQKDWNYFVWRMVVEGKTSLSVAAYLKDPWKYSQVQQRGPGYDFIDPGKEASAAIDLVNNKMQTLDQFYGEKGQDWKAQTTQWLDEQEFLKDEMKKRKLEEVVAPINPGKPKPKEKEKKDEFECGNCGETWEENK